MGFDLQKYIKETSDQWGSLIQDSSRIYLWDQGSVEHFDVTLKRQEPSLIPSFAKSPLGAVIVCAGGSYRWKEPLEAFPHTVWINRSGFHAFVLDYRVSPFSLDCSLGDLQRAIRLLRSHSEQMGIEKDKIVVMGFSSGGHLAARACTHFDGGSIHSPDPVERESCRPDGQILCYPHITYDPYKQDDPAFLDDFFGVGYSQQDLDRLNVALHVQPDTPPAFLWGMQGDWQYKQRQWQQYADALDKYGIPVGYHVFPGGSHSEAREARHPIWKQWTGLCDVWLHTWVVRSPERI